MNCRFSGPLVCKQLVRLGGDEQILPVIYYTPCKNTLQHRFVCCNCCPDENLGDGQELYLIVRKIPSADVSGIKQTEEHNVFVRSRREIIQDFEVLLGHTTGKHFRKQKYAKQSGVKFSY